MSFTRCEGHQGHIILKIVLEISCLVNPLHSMAHLLRQHSNRDRLISSCMRRIDRMVQMHEGSPPQQAKRYLRDIFQRTLLRGPLRDQLPEPNTKRSKSRQDRIDRMWAAFEDFAAAFNGFVDASGTIHMYADTRRITRAAVAHSGSSVGIVGGVRGGGSPIGKFALVPGVTCVRSYTQIILCCWGRRDKNIPTSSLIKNVPGCSGALWGASSLIKNVLITCMVAL